METHPFDWWVDLIFPLWSLPSTKNMLKSNINSKNHSYIIPTKSASHNQGYLLGYACTVLQIHCVLHLSSLYALQDAKK